MKISFPDYVVHTDTELEHVRTQYFELAKKGEERNCQMSKELRCRLIRNTMTSMIAILRAKGDAESDRYPSKPEITAMARRIVQYYPMLQDLNNKNTWVSEMYPVMTKVFGILSTQVHFRTLYFCLVQATVYGQLFKRLQNVRTPQKTVPEGRASKKRHLQPKMPRLEQPTDTDEIDSSDSTIILNHSSEENTSADSAINEKGDLQMYI